MNSESSLNVMTLPPAIIVWYMGKDVMPKLPLERPLYLSTSSLPADVPFTQQHTRLEFLLK